MNTATERLVACASTGFLQSTGFLRPWLCCARKRRALALVYVHAAGATALPALFTAVLVALRQGAVGSVFAHASCALLFVSMLCVLGAQVACGGCVLTKVEQALFERDDTRDEQQGAAMQDEDNAGPPGAEAHSTPRGEPKAFHTRHRAWILTALGLPVTDTSVARAHVGSSAAVLAYMVCVGAWALKA